MAEQVGEGYIEVKARIDSSNIVAQSRAITAKASREFGDGWMRGVKKAISDADSQFTSHFNKHISAFQALQNQKVRAATDAQRRISTLMNDIISKTNKDRRISDSFVAEGKRVADAFVREQNRAFSATTTAYTKGIRAIEKMRLEQSEKTNRETGNRFQALLGRMGGDADHHSKRIGRNLGNNISRGIDAALSLLPGRMEALFSGRGGPIGLALGMAIIGGVAVTMPILGAMISGAIFAGFGTGVVALGIALVAKDSRVVAAAERLKQMFTDRVWNSRGAEAFAVATTTALNRVTNALSKWSPFLDRILQVGSQFVGPITTGLIGFVNGFLGPLTRMMESRFMAEIMNIAASGFIRIGEALGRFFDRFLNNPAALEGAKMGLHAIFTIMVAIIDATGTALVNLSAFWFNFNKDPDGAGGAISNMEKFKKVWNQIGDDVGKIGSVVLGVFKAIGNQIAEMFKDRGQNEFLKKLGELWRTIVDKVLPALGDMIERNLPKLRDAFDAVGVVLTPVVDALIGLGNWFADEDNEDNIDRIVTVIIAGTVAFKAYNTAVRAAAAANLIFASTGGAGMMGGQKDKKDGGKGKPSGKGGAVGGLGGLLFTDSPWGIGGGLIGGTLGGGLIGGVAGIGLGLLFEKELDLIMNISDSMFPGIKENTKKFFNELFDGNFKGAWKTFKDNFDQRMAEFGGKWNNFWTGTKVFAKSQWQNMTTSFSSTWGDLKNTLTEEGDIWKGRWNSLTSGLSGAWDKVWGAIPTSVKNAFGNIGSIGLGGFEMLKGLFSGNLGLIKTGWNDAWNGIKGLFGSIWPTIQNVGSGALENIKNGISARMGDIRARWSSAWATVSNIAGSSWNAIFSVGRGAMDRIRGFMSDRMSDVGNTWSTKWGNVRNILGSAWNTMFSVGQGAMDRIRGFMSDRMEDVKNNWNSKWGSTKNILGSAWNLMSSVSSGAMDRIRGFVSDKMNALQNNWNNSWNGISRFIGDRWNDMKGASSSATDWIRDRISGALNTISTNWSRKWNSMAEAFAQAMRLAGTHAKNGINGIIDIINSGIGKINNVLGKLGITQRIPTIPRLAEGGMVLPGFAKGGTVRGPGGSTADRVKAMLSPGEYVIRASSAKKIGYDALDAMNQTGKKPKDSGNPFGFAPGGVALMTAWIKGKVPSTRVVSGYRPGDPGYHGKGQAIDMVWPDGSERRGGGLAQQAFNHIKGNFFTGIAELIWDFARGQAVWNGKNHFFTGGGAGPGTHNDHIHWAMGSLTGKGGGGLLGLLEWLFKPWEEVMKKLVQPAIDALTAGFPDNGIGWVMRGGAKFLGNQIIPWIKKKFEEEQQKMMFAGGTLGDGGGGAAKWASTIQQALQMLGLPANWLNPMITLIGRESGGNPNAINRSDSNAARGTPSMGLAQVIGPTFAANRDNRLPNNAFHPLANIVAALNYIKRRYGSIFNVQQANASKPPKGYGFGGKVFDTGGILSPGMTMAYNGTGQNEYVFTGNQMGQMGGSGCSHMTKVYVDGVEVAHRSMIDDNNNQLVNTIRRGRRGGR